MKGFIGLTTAIILIAAVMIGAYLFVPGVADAFSLGEPKTCTETPLDYRCECPEGKQKVGIISFSCVDMPTVPSSWSLPIDSWGEAIAFAYSQMQGVPKCDGDLYFSNPIEGMFNANVNNAYGGAVYDSSGNVLGYAMNVECLKQTSPAMGYEAWRCEFDPNDGFVYTRSCNPNYVSNCPEISLDMKTEPIEPICGDLVCSPGETVESCRADCFIDNPYCGDGICGNSQVQVNKCELADGSEEQCAITGYKPWTGEPCSISDWDCVRTYGDMRTEDQYICPADC